jgi:hypothetical protein
MVPSSQSPVVVAFGVKGASPRRAYRVVGRRRSIAGVRRAHVAAHGLMLVIVLARVNGSVVSC